MNAATGWPEVLAGVRTDCLDCLQVNLAVLADRWHGAGTHLRLGVAAGFRPRPGDPLPVAAPTLDDRLAEAAALTGVVAREHHVGVDGPALRRMLADDRGAWYVVADAYALPWVPPYHGHEHIEHSFLVVPDGGGYLVVDGYEITTPRGVASPGSWRLPADELDAALAGTGLAIRVDAAEPSGDTAGATPVADEAAVAAYVEAYRRYPDRGAALARLTLETWTLARSWRLFAHWAGTDTAAAHSREWDRLAEHVYIAARRVARGGAEPVECLTRLGALLRDPPTAAAPSDPDVHAAVVRVTSHVLGVPAERVAATASLTELPAFNSFRMLEIVEQLEAALRVELPASDLTPDNMSDVEALSRVFTRCRRGA